MKMISCLDKNGNLVFLFVCCQRNFSVFVLAEIFFCQPKTIFQKLVKRKLSAGRKPANYCQTLINKELCLIADNGLGLLLCWNSMLVQPNCQPNKFIKVQITNKSRKEIRQPKLLLILNKKMKIYSSASIEANPCKLQFCSYCHVLSYQSCPLFIDNSNPSSIFRFLSLSK